jgi:hypothetical protein
MSRVKTIVKEQRDPVSFCSAVWKIRSDAMRRSSGRLDSPLEAFSLGQLLKATG